MHLFIHCISTIAWCLDNKQLELSVYIWGEENHLRIIYRFSGMGNALVRLLWSGRCSGTAYVVDLWFHSQLSHWAYAESCWGLLQNNTCTLIVALGNRWNALVSRLWKTFTSVICKAVHCVNIMYNITDLGSQNAGRVNQRSSTVSFTWAHTGSCLCR